MDEYTRERVTEELLAGRKIQAIKLLREESGIGLAEAKTQVEALDDELRNSTEYAGRMPKKSGCAGMLLLPLLIGAAWELAPW